MSEQEEVKDQYKQIGKKKPELLNMQQINNAKQTIDKNHPLARIPLLKALPYLHYVRCCLKKPKKDFRLALRKSLLKKMGLKMPKTDIQLEQDPFLRLGYGMNAFFDLLRYLSILMVLIFVFSIPSMSIYSSYGAIKDDAMGIITQFSLGNMGGAKTIAFNLPLSTPDIQLKCKLGEIQLDQIRFGLIPSSSNGDFVSNSTVTDKCLNDLVDHSYIYGKLNEKCNQKTECNINYVADNVSFLKPLDQVTNSNPECRDLENTNIFVQVPCKITDEKVVNKRQVEGLVIACMGVFISLFFTNYLVDYLRNVFKNQFIEWDVKTITAGDYSVELDITEAQYKYFLDNIYDPLSGVSKIESFKSYLKKTLEDRLTRMPDLGYEEPAPERITIAMISFAYDNAELINLLRQRGQHIKFQRFDKMRLVNTKIDQVKSDPAKMKKFYRPVTAFLTFENEEGLNRMLAYNEVCEADPQEYGDCAKLLGAPLDIEEASEPTDIIWENRHFTKFQRFNRIVLVIIIVSLLLFASFVLLFFLSSSSSQAAARYPTSQCKDQYKIFQPQTLYDLVRNEQKANTEAIADGKDPTYSYTPCYCKQYFKDLSTSDKGYSNFQGFCSEYTSAAFSAKILGYSVSFAIVIVNLIFKSILISLIKWIGEDTHSQQLKTITNGIFIAQFFNTGILLALVTANFAEIGLPLADYFNSTYPDFTSEWYTVVGYKLTQTMIINAIFPFVEFGIAYSKLWAFRKMDRSWGKDEYKTKKTSLQLYVDLYSGPEYMIHFKYSGIMNVTFVTMMYGMGMPVLFLIAGFNYFVLMSLERILVAYFYQLPPTLDDKLTKNAIGILKFAPLLYLFVGYWMLSNKQIFHNQFQFITTIKEVMLTNHTFGSIFVDQASPLLLIGGALFVIIFMQTFFKKTLRNWGFSSGGAKINVDENLPFFFTAIRLQDADWLLAENKVLEEEYGFEIINDQVQKILDTVGQPKKSIQGVPYYIILSNPLYYRDFQYIPCCQDDRKELIVDDDDDEGNDTEQSDIVSIMLNLAYIPEEVAEKFRFETGFNKKFKPAMDAYRIGRQALIKAAGGKTLGGLLGAIKQQKLADLEAGKK